MLQAGMQNNILASLTRLSDDDLVARLKGLVARDHDLTAQIVAHLAELDTPDVFLRDGYGSLFSTAGTPSGSRSGRPTTASRSPAPPDAFR
jgi:hypothetical protein